MKTITSPLLLIVSILFAASSATAAIVVSNTGSLSTNFNGGTMNSTTISFTSTANTAVFFLFSGDTGSGPNSTATFAGESMTIVEETRAVIGYIAGDDLDGNTSGDIVLSTTTDFNSEEIAYWGVVEGIDVNNIKTSVGSSISGSSAPYTQSNSNLSSLGLGDIVYSVFAVNNYAPTAYSGGLVRVDGNSVEHDATITTDTIGTAGNFSASTSVDTNPSAFGASIAFTAVPEPSAALLCGMGAVMLLLCRKRANPLFPFLMRGDGGILPKPEKANS